MLRRSEFFLVAGAQGPILCFLLRHDSFIIPDGVKAAIERLDSEDLTERTDAAAAIQKQADGIIPFLVTERMNAQSEEVRARLRQVIENRYQSFDETSCGPRLPYGTEIAKAAGGCGGTYIQPDGTVVSVACGMAAVPAAGRKFLKFLVK